MKTNNCKTSGQSNLT